MGDTEKLSERLSGALGRIGDAMDSGHPLSSGTMSTVRGTLLKGLRPETPRDAAADLFRNAKRFEGSLHRRLKTLHFDEPLVATTVEWERRAESMRDVSFMIGVLSAYAEALQQAMKLSSATPQIPDLHVGSSAEEPRGQMSERQRQVCALLLKAKGKGLSNRELAETLDLEIRAVSRSLRVLRAKGLVRSFPFGRRTQNFLSPGGRVFMSDTEAP